MGLWLGRSTCDEYAGDMDTSERLFGEMISAVNDADFVNEPDSWTLDQSIVNFKDIMIKKWHVQQTVVLFISLDKM